MKAPYIILSCLAAMALGAASVQAQSDEATEKKINDIISQMTIQEKIEHIGGINTMYVRPFEKFGIPQIVMSDGPVGVRCYGRSTAYPAGVITASSWDKDLAKRLGVSVGNDCRARGVNILLGPGMNIMRTPLCGRNFEYFSEDPYLAGTMATQYVTGLQSREVAACVKHFAGNNMEDGREVVSDRMSDKTLHEIYLKAFQMAIEKGHAACVMNSYNLINGTYSTENHNLNLDILKGAWKFDGVLMSDWDATHNTVIAANAGLDLDMNDGSARYFNLRKMLPAVEDGRISEDVINDKVRRILRLVYRFNWAKRPQAEDIAKDDPTSAATALDVARNGIVLLKNADNILPIGGMKKIAVIGPNADANVHGGGSSCVDPFHWVTTLEGLKKALPKAEFVYDNGGGFDPRSTTDCYIAHGSDEHGMNVEYFNNDNLQGKPVWTGKTEFINFEWGSESPVPDVVIPDGFSARFTGFIRTADADEYTFQISGDDGFRVWIDGKKVVDEWRDQAEMIKKFNYKFETAGDHEVKIEYYDRLAAATLKMGCAKYTSNDRIKEIASDCDYAIVCVGFNGATESEGFDRTFNLPKGQDELIERVAAANPHTIVVYNAGGAINMQPWLDSVKGVIFAGYPGQEGGTAIAEIISGQVNPSGKLPVSFEKDEKDNPSYGNVHPKKGENFINYNEGVLVGYRYYDTKDINVQFPFGYGLSYTSFEYSNLKVKKGQGNNYTITVDVKNIGQVAGAESVQLYVEPAVAQEGEPIRTLGDFGKTPVIKPGETSTITMALDNDSFSTYNTDAGKFVVNPGKYAVKIGGSSRDLRLAKTINIK